MRQASRQLSRRTPGRGLIDITPEVAGWVGEQQMKAGLLTIFCRHTSASLLIQENADPDVQTDLEAFFEIIAPELSGRYVHEDEGPTTCRNTCAPP